MATDALGISQVSAVLSQFIAYIPNVIAAVLILVLAALLARFVVGLVRGATAPWLRQRGPAPGAWTVRGRPPLAPSVRGDGTKGGRAWIM